VLPQESGFVHTTSIKKNVRTLTKMCSFAQLYFDPEEITSMFEEFLPYVRLSLSTINERGNIDSLYSSVLLSQKEVLW
jgi:hypothetical protein